MNRPKAPRKQAKRNLPKSRLENLKICSLRCLDLKVSLRVKVKVNIHLRRRNSSTIHKSLKKISRLKKSMMKNF